LSSEPSLLACLISFSRDLFFSFSSFFTALSRALMKASSCKWCSSCSIDCLCCSERFVTSSSPFAAPDLLPTDLTRMRMTMIAATTVTILAKNKP
ncbi:hypothetical protein D030_3389B, partial [Vibrio parahaemolyticus AQ3810]